MEILISLIKNHIQVFGYYPSIWELIPEMGKSYAELIDELNIDYDSFYGVVNM